MSEHRSIEDGFARAAAAAPERVKPLALVPEFRRPLLLAILWGTLGSVLSIVQMFVLSTIISEVFLSRVDLAQIGTLLTWFLGLSVAQALCILAREVSTQNGVSRAQVSLRRRCVIYVLRLGPAWVQEERSGELAAMLGDGIERLDMYLARYLPQVVFSLLVPLLILLVAVRCDPLSALLFLLTVPLIPLLMILIGRRAELQSQVQWKALTQMSAHFLDVVQGLTTLKLFGGSQAELERVARISETFRARTMEVLRLAFLSGAVLEFLTTMAIGLVAVMLGIRLIDHHITLRDALFLLLLAPEFYRPLRELGAARHAGLEGRAVLQHLNELLARFQKAVPARSATSSASSMGPKGLENPSGECGPVLCMPLWPKGEPLEVAVYNLGYVYPGSEQPALRAISLVLPAKSCTALVGSSGAGKSTLVRLLLRWLEPDQGTITANGFPIQQLSPEAWCASIAFVPQRPYLFSGSIRENILLGRSSASVEEVVNAAEMAGALEWIQRLPRGFETPVGEHGARLSAGQVQRIALARAFLKDASLLILDEPSSSLDPESEQAMCRALVRLARERTVLVIAHRRSTIAVASRVLVLERGRIVENVAPDMRLLPSGGISYSMAQAGTGERSPETVSALFGGDNERTLNPSTSLSSSSDVFSEEGKTSSTMSPQEVMPTREGARGRGVLWRLCRMQMHLIRPVLLAALLGCILAVSNLVLLGMAAYLLNASTVIGLLTLLPLPIFVVRLLSLVRPLARYGERYVSHDVTFRLLAGLRTRVYACLEPLAPALLLDYRSGDVLARLVSDIDELQYLYLNLFAPLVVALALGLFVFLVFYSFSLVLAWTTLAFLALAGGVLPLVCWWLARGLGARQLVLHAELKAVLLDSIQGMPDLLACGGTALYLHKIDHMHMHLGRVQRRRGWIAGLQEALTSLLRQGALCMVLILAIPLVNAGQIDGIFLGSLAFLSLASFEIVPPLGQVGKFLDSALAAGRRLFALLDALPAVRECSQPLALSELPSNCGYDISFEHLCFSYSRGENEDKEKRASVQEDEVWYQANCQRMDQQGYQKWRGGLRDIELHVSAGRRVAIVGSSGGGKSTLLRLLLRVWDSNAGMITLNGVDIRRYALNDLRSQMAVVTQDTYLFNTSLRANLLLAKPGASDAELMEALERAQLGACVRQLPAGLATWIGEQGQRLSGGERQRLALACALLKDAPILLLDEVTANLDVQTELEVFNTLHRLMDGRTTLLVTHRLIAMEKMDEIIVLEDGRIQERGTHGYLLALQGRYAQLWHIQQATFTDPVEDVLFSSRGTSRS